MRINSLQRRLCLYIIAAVIVTFATIAAVVYFHSRSSERESAVTMANLQLQSILYGIDKELFEVERETAIAVSTVNRLLSQPDSLMEVVNNLVTSNNRIMGGSVAFEPGFFAGKGSFMEYVSIDQSGQPQQLHLGIDSDYDYTDMEWYASVEESGESRWSEPYFDKGGGNCMMTTFAIPILDDDGGFAGVMTADVALDDFVSRIAELRPYPDSYTVVASRNGTIISHPDSNAILRQTLSARADSLNNNVLRQVVISTTSGNTGTAHLRLDGTDKFICYSPLDRIGWSVMYISPYSNILDSLGGSVIWIMVVLGVALVILGIIVRRIIKSATEPMEQLTDAAYRISEGDFNAGLPVVTHDDEVGRLRDAFSHMQSSLSEYIVKLTDTTREKQRIESELSIARQIQMNLVPRTFSPFADYEGLELYAILRPAKEVGGDFYDFFFKDNKLVFAIGDVSGKGVPAALVMSVTRTLFRVNGGNHSTASDIIKGINDVLATDNDSNMFVTLFVGVYDLDTCELDCCNAGHDYPMIVSSENVEMLEGDSNIPVGVMSDYKFVGSLCQMTAGDTLLLYTDGVVEAINSDNEQFGEERLTKIAFDNAKATPHNLLSDIVAKLKDFENTGSQFDDITLLAFKQKRNNISTESTLVISNNLNEISKIPVFLEAFVTEGGIDNSILFNLNLVIEEIVVNTISYGYPNPIDDSIRITVSCDKEAVIVVIEDSAAPFNPLESNNADIESSLAQRKIGGLGIHIVKQLCSDVEYGYSGNKNKLTLILTKTTIPQ